MKNRFYVVSQMDGLFVGRVFRSWEKCQAFMEGHKGLRHKGFPTEEEAKAFLAEEEQRYVMELESGLHSGTEGNAGISQRNGSRSAAPDFDQPMAKDRPLDKEQRLAKGQRLTKNRPLAKEQPLTKDQPLTNDQQRALELMESGENVFLTGSAGTGKSYVLQRFIRQMRGKKKRVLTCAPTGIAALNVNGITIHRAFGAPIGTIDPRKKVKEPGDLIVRADVIIIDEISMCRIDLFEYVMKTIARAEELAQEKNQKQGKEDRLTGRLAEKKQVVLVGDFFQLPPVMRREDRVLLQKYYPGLTQNSFGFPFQSSLWFARGFRMVSLHQVVRQEEQDFVEALNMARRGDAASIEYFQTHCSLGKLEGGIELYGRNGDVKRANEQGLEKLTTVERIYQAEKWGTVRDSDQPTEEALRLKEGCRVMLLVNDVESRYQNGSLGNVTEMFTDCIRVRLDNGIQVDVEPFTWSIKGLEQVKNKAGEMEQVLVEIGTFKQFPLKLAYAVTIHKSQGQTYDKVNLNPQAWDPGQLYVALSRVRCAENLYLYQRIASRWLIASKEVIAFYQQGALEQYSMFERQRTPEQQRTPERQRTLDQQGEER